MLELEVELTKVAVVEVEAPFSAVAVSPLVLVLEAAAGFSSAELPHPANKISEQNPNTKYLPIFIILPPQFWWYSFYTYNFSTNE
ncbi:hypothetical protein GCM10019993_20650 [Enterococcus pseudoavium]